MLINSVFIQIKNSIDIMNKNLTIGDNQLADGQ